MFDNIIFLKLTNFFCNCNIVISIVLTVMEILLFIVSEFVQFDVHCKNE